jgi:hypothetical protein
MGSVLAGSLGLFLAMREINLAFFLPRVSTPVFVLVFRVVDLVASTCFGTDLGKIVGNSGLGLGNQTS